MLYNSMSVPEITESHTLKKPVTILLSAFYLNFKNTDTEQDPNFEGKESDWCVKSGDGIINAFNFF